jgi:hypothetical protein
MSRGNATQLFAPVLMYSSDKEPDLVLSKGIAITKTEVSNVVR